MGPGEYIDRCLGERHGQRGRDQVAGGDGWIYANHRRTAHNLGPDVVGHDDAHGEATGVHEHPAAGRSGRHRRPSSWGSTAT
jgi:hypothetical protein